MLRRGEAGIRTAPARKLRHVQRSSLSENDLLDDVSMARIIGIDIMRKHVYLLSVLIEKCQLMFFIEGMIAG